MLTLFSLLQESPHGRRLVYAIVSLGLIHVAGTIGYLMLAPPTLGVVDALFMTFITISTIGYEELIPLTGRPQAEIFTIVIAFAGIGAMTFIFSTLTTFMLETNLNRAYRRKRMEIDSQRMKGHYIICGAGRVGSYVIEELTAAGASIVVLESDTSRADVLIDQRPDLVIITGDATQDDLLRRAAVPSAAGLFAVTGDDAHNLVITLSAKHMNPALRVIARVHERHNEGKMLRIGADAIVSPDFSGAVRASALMIRPQVVSVLDRMMRTETGVKLEEYVLPADMKLRNVGEIGHSHDWFVLALRRGERWRFNPEPTETLEPGETVVVLLSERGRPALMRALGLA